AGKLFSTRAIFHPPPGAGFPQIGVCCDAKPLFAWGRWGGPKVLPFGQPRNGVEIRPLSASEELGPILFFPGFHKNRSFGQLQLAMNAIGAAALIWVKSNQRVQACVRSADGVFSCLEKFDGGGSHPRVAIDDDGDAVFVWSHRDTIIARFRSA